MLIKLYPENPNERQVRQIVDVLKSGGIIIYPTDTIYGVGCDIFNRKAVERVARLKQINLNKANFSFICHDLRHLSDFTRPVPNHVFKVMKRNLPGPFTFILNGNTAVPRLFRSNKKTIGIRIPDNNIIRAIVKELGNPIMSTSIKNDEDEILEYITDPELIHETYEDKVDVVIDGGYGTNEASTVIDCTGGDLEIIRQGAGSLIE